MAASSFPFPCNGISLGVFPFFIESCGGKNKLEGMTTADICEKFVKPKTLETRLSYCDWLSMQPNISNSCAVAKANVFISHAWKYLFLDVVQALENHFQDKEETVILWFDLFSNNQHIAVDLDFHWWCATFKSAINDMKHTVMIFSPWNDPIPLTRAWCLFELYCTIDTNSKFEVAVSMKEQTRFISDVRHDITVIINMIGAVNVKRSEAWNPEDKKRIFDVVDQTVGFDAINKMIFELLREWVVHITLEFINQEKEEMIKNELTVILAELYQQQGKYNQAEEIYRQCLNSCDKIYGTDHPNTLSVTGNLASLYENQGKYELAEPLYIQSLSVLRNCLGPYHNNTISTMNNLGMLYQSQEKYQLAEELYNECLQIMCKSLGEENSRTLICMNNLGTVYIKQNKFELAEKLYEKCLCIRKQSLGEDHPSVMIALNNLSGLYQQQNKSEKALICLNECLIIRKTRLGDDHPDTLDTIHNIGGVQYSLGYLDEAEIILQQCYNKKSNILGINHPSTISTLHILSSVKQLKSKKNEEENELQNMREREKTGMSLVILKKREKSSSKTTSKTTDYKSKKVHAVG